MLDENTKVMIFFLLIVVIAVIQIIAYYSIGKSHGGKLQIAYPSMEEWIYLIIIASVANWATTSVVKNFIGHEINITDTIGSVVKNLSDK